MKKKADPEADLREVMLKHILQAEFSAQIEDDAINLSSGDGWWWREKASRVPHARLGKNLEAAFTMFSQLSEKIVQGADWFLLAPRILSLSSGSVGTKREVVAATKSTTSSAPADRCSWKQGDICLTISIAKSKPFRITLHIDEGPVVKIKRVVWVDMASIESDPFRPPVLRYLEVTPASDERTFTVESKPAEVTRRLSAVMAAEKSGISDARLLLPFVEWD